MNFLRNRKDSERPLSVTSSTVDSKCQKVCDDLTDSFITLANEPSLAYFRLQEHIRKTTPALLAERAKISRLQNDLQGRCFDVDYAIEAVNSMARATPHMSRLNELLKSCLSTKLQLDYAQKQNADFEMGIDMATLVPDEGECPPSTSGKKLQSESNPRSPALTDTAPRLGSFTSSVSNAAVEMRHQAISLTKRALLTRSVEVSSSGNIGSSFASNLLGSPSQNAGSVSSLPEHSAARSQENMLGKTTFDASDGSVKEAP
ncbi:unnamed protein product [Calicophoron daubneyi]|uniref:BLOC-1-related complex subunit 8 n=1 Tax=Calicophoron daubneyi TaxID=300641 RepID=A0AAV2SVJ3_CALDB